jgi:hypothetical protein
MDGGGILRQGIQGEGSGFYTLSKVEIPFSRAPVIPPRESGDGACSRMSTAQPVRWFQDEGE